MDIEEANRGILEYNLANVFGGNVRLMRGLDVIGTGPASIARTGVERSAYDDSEVEKTAIRVVLNRTQFQFPAVNDTVEEIGKDKFYTVVRIGGFDANSVEIDCVSANKLRSGSSRR
ncbi:MAG: hypothetical protein AB7F32_12930 [Victivallaceae bacterium]